MQDPRTQGRHGNRGPPGTSVPLSPGAPSGRGCPRPPDHPPIRVPEHLLCAALVLRGDTQGPCPPGKTVCWGRGLLFMPGRKEPAALTGGGGGSHAGAGKPGMRSGGRGSARGQLCAPPGLWKVTVRGPRLGQGVWPDKKQGHQVPGGFPPCRQSDLGESQTPLPGSQQETPCISGEGDGGMATCQRAPLSTQGTWVPSPPLRCPPLPSPPQQAPPLPPVPA